MRRSFRFSEPVEHCEAPSEVHTEVRFDLTCGFVSSQWLALLLLMAGATVSQISGCEGSMLAAPVNVRGDPQL